MTYKRLIAMFLVGVLLIGIGTGVCVAEFGSFVYKGVKEFAVDADTMTTHRHRFELITENGADTDRIMLGGNLSPYTNGELVFIPDETMPDNELVIEVTYDKRFWDSFINATYITKSVEPDGDTYTRQYDSSYPVDQAVEDAVDYTEYAEEHPNPDTVNMDTNYDDVPPDYQPDITMQNYIDIIIHNQDNWLLGNYRVILDDLRNKRIYDYDTPAGYVIKIYGTSDTLERITY